MTDPQTMAAFVETSRRFARREVATLVGTEGRDGRLDLLPRVLDRAAAIGLLASPDPEAAGHEHGVWGRASLEEGEAVSLALLGEVACACAGVAACLHVAGLGSIELPAGRGSAAVGLLSDDWRLEWSALDSPPAGGLALAKDGAGYRLTGSLRAVAASPGCELLVVYAGHSGAWQRVAVPLDAPGVVRDDVGPRCGLSALELHRVRFTDLRLDSDQLLGPGHPANHLRRLCLGLAAVALGNARGALEAARGYAEQRHQGGSLIAELPAVRLLLGGAAGRIDASAALLAQLSRSVEPRAALTAKLHVTELCCAAVSDCLQVLGGYGYMEDHRLEKRLRDALTLKGMAPGPMELRWLSGTGQDPTAAGAGKRCAPPVDIVRARRKLGAVGRLMFDTEPRTIWERDTATLPRALQVARRRYRDFARTELAPIALRADRDPAAVSVPDLFCRAAAQGLQTELMPPPWGTLRLSALFGRALLLPMALKAEELCAACGGLGLALLAHDLGAGPLFVSGDLGCLRLLDRVYREIRAGEPSIMAFAITEPDAGSDVEDSDGAAGARLSCHYRRVPGGFELSGRKCFISDGAVARWVTLFAAEQGHGVETWTCFLLDSSMRGFSVGRKERKMGQRAADASELVLEGVIVPRGRVVGPVGGGWAINRNVLNFSRPAVGAIALGIARGAFEHAAAFCQAARLAGRPLVDYQEVRLTLADMLVKLSAMRATVWQATRYRFPFQGAGAIAKVFCSDTAWELCQQAMELLGDHGYLHGGAEKAARDARLTQIYEGTNQINRLALYESQTGAELGAG